MWYAVQVKTGDEEKIKLLCNKLISSKVLQECFIPYYEKKTRYMGSWHISLERLFPGYVFMVSDLKDSLRTEAKRIPNLVRILGDGNEIIPLDRSEVEFLSRFGEKDHCIRMSQGYVANEKIIIVDGPMKDFVGKIMKIDRHKRSACIEISFFGRRMEIQVGLEIIKKI